MEDRYWIAVAADTGEGRLPRRDSGGSMGAASARPAVAARRRTDWETMVVVWSVGSVV